MKKFKFNKKLISVMLTFTLILTLCFGINTTAYASTVNGFNYKAGDILVTSSTSSSGITGHAGIVLPDGQNVLHIAGVGYSPTVISISDWLSTYTSTNVVRCDSTSSASAAANWTLSYYVNGSGASATYAITTNIYNLTTVYCSQIVWQAYYYGAGLTYKVNTLGLYYTPTIIAPYDFTNTDNQSYNGFSSVYSINW